MLVSNDSQAAVHLSLDSQINVHLHIVSDKTSFIFNDDSRSGEF